MQPDTIAVGDLRFPAPGHLSHSSRETLTRCAKSWFLRYLAKAPTRPALWSAGGSAVHEVTEHWDREAVERGLDSMEHYPVGSIWAGAFQAQLAQARKREPNENLWGRSPSEPIEVWNANGPAFVRAWIDWRRRSPYTIWTTPDGVPAIELDVSGRLPGCPVEIQGFIDRVFHDPVMDQLIIVDLKTGKRPPSSAAQFGTYAALLDNKYGVRVRLGVPFMNRRATLGRPWDLSEFTPDAVGSAFGEAWEQIQSGEFPADTSDCFICDVSAACAAKGGPLAAMYDPDAEGYETPPF